MDIVELSPAYDSNGKLQTGEHEAVSDGQARSQPSQPPIWYTTSYLFSPLELRIAPNRAQSEMNSKILHTRAMHTDMIHVNVAEAKDV